MSEKKLTGFTDIRLDFKEEYKEITGIRDFPKYTTQIINIANQNAQGTRPKVVGKVSKLIDEKCPEKTYEGWRKWYLEKYPHSIDKATEKIMRMLEKMKNAYDEIDKNMVRDWVEDLVINKTAEGLIIQEIVLETLAEMKGEKYRKATPQEESRNIDGYVGAQPISVKPTTYLTKKTSVREKINVPIVYYKKTNKYLRIYFNEDDIYSRLG